MAAQAQVVQELDVEVADPQKDAQAIKGNPSHMPEIGDRIMVVKEAWLSLILSGTKTMEVRGKPAGTGHTWIAYDGLVYASAEIAECILLSKDDFEKTRGQHRHIGKAPPLLGQLQDATRGSQAPQTKDNPQSQTQQRRLGRRREAGPRHRGRRACGSRPESQKNFKDGLAQDRAAAPIAQQEVSAPAMIWREPSVHRTKAFFALYKVEQLRHATEPARKTRGDSVISAARVLAP